MKILFLYTELAGYFVSCIQELSKQVEEIHIVRWPVNKEAPFQFVFPGNVVVYERNHYNPKSLLQLARQINPDKIICCGWIDKGYLSICRNFRGRVPTVMSMDNHWQATPKQQLMRLIAPFTIYRCFSDVWVPGTPQKKYALKLHFREVKIQTGFYSADTDYFSNIFKKISSGKKEYFPKRILYVGRYIESKGIFTLWNAFIKAVELTHSDWELWCLGTGELYEQRVEHPRIKHFGFVQPSEMESYLAQTSVFMLPSSFEPWGVVVHEMAASGMPMICSDKVGAASAFLKPGKNGFIFKAGDEKELQSLLVKVMLMNSDELVEMGEVSHEIGQQITPKIWAEKVMGFNL
jgi:glycosyltransferase involved in cell wall biosynthesis